MRPDTTGFFWDDQPTDQRGRAVRRNMPPIPDTGWTSPTSFPNLAAARVISLDCETYDPELITHGPGWARGLGHIVGVSIGADNDGRWYFPIRHEVEPEFNLDPNTVLAWLRDALSNPYQPKVGANLIYDIGWLRQENVQVAGELVDVQFMEALLDERAKVALEILAQKYLGEGKESNVLYQWCSDYYGGAVNDKQRANIYRSPPRLVGPYAESDADLPLRLSRVMYPFLAAEGLVDLFRMECALIPLMIEMRFAGVRVDIDRAEELRDTLEKRIELEQAKLNALAGFRVNTNAGDSLAKAFDAVGLGYKTTTRGKPSFTKQFLGEVNHPMGETIRELRRLVKLKGTFIESYILDANVNGRVYGQFHLLRGEDGGTRSGRLSSSSPNLQNIPARDDELAPLVRGLYVFDEGHFQWRKYDYSQIEYRFLVHFAVGPGSDNARERYRRDPKTDYHDMTLDEIAVKTGWDVSTPAQRKHWRRPTKNINFGLIFGMGKEKLSRDLGLSKTEGDALFKAYHEGVPFAKATMDATSEEASRLGYITTILGRKSRFDLWEPDDRSSRGMALPIEEAILNYGRIKRAYVHKALNRRLQGSAADLLKKAMYLCWTTGVFHETGVPRLTVHDELDFSDPGGKDEAFQEMQHILESAISLRVPVMADAETGPDWGHVA